MFFQNRPVLFGPGLLELVADDHRLTAEHPFDLFDRGLEQRPRIISCRLLIGSFNTLAFEYQLKHGSLSLPTFFALESIVDPLARGSPEKLYPDCKQLKDLDLIRNLSESGYDMVSVAFDRRSQFDCL